MERVLWREPGLAYTQRYEQFIYEHVQNDTIAQVARDESLSEDIVQHIFERRATNNHSARLSPCERAVLGRSDASQRTWWVLPDYLRLHILVAFNPLSR